jgi:hypothetical protein
MSSYACPPASLEALLRDACRRAVALGLSFTNQLRLYRSILALAREVRLRLGGAMPERGSGTLSALLAAVCERASELGADPELPLPDAILLQRLAVQLSRAARRADATEPANRWFSTQQSMHREEPAAQTFYTQEPMHREESAQPQAAGAAEPPGEKFSPQHPIQREAGPQRKAPETPDDSLSAWRNDHTTDRDQRAYEKLRTVIDDRLISKVRAMNKRDREEREAAERVEAA